MAKEMATDDILKMLFEEFDKTPSDEIRRAILTLTIVCQRQQAAIKGLEDREIMRRAYQ